MSQLGLYYCFNAIFSNYSDFRFNRYFKNNNFDIFILGNSRAVNSVNEKQGSILSGKNVVNLSYNGMPTDNIIDLVDDINEKYTGKLIFIEISSFFLKVNSTNEYSFYMDKSKFIFSRFENTRYRYIKLLSYNNEFFLRNLYYLNRSDQDCLQRNGTFIDLNQYSLPESYYADRVHTNSNGAVFLTQKLLNFRIE